MEKTITLSMDETELLREPLLKEIEFYRKWLEDSPCYFLKKELCELETLFTRIFGVSPDNQGGETK